MAKTVAELQTERDELVRGLGKVQSGYSIGDRSIQFRTPGQIREAIAEIDRQIAALQGTTVNQVRVSTSKGL